MASNLITMHQTSNDFSSTFQGTNNVFLSQQISINHHKTASIQKMCVAKKQHKIWCILPTNSQFNCCTSTFRQQCTYVSVMTSNWITMHQTSNDFNSTIKRTNNVFLPQQISISRISAKTNRAPKPGTLQLILTGDSDEAWAPLDWMTARSAPLASEVGSGARYGLRWHGRMNWWHMSRR